MGVSAGRRTERKQRWTVAAIRTDGQSCLGNEADAVAQGVQPFDTGQMIHRAKGVAVNVQFAGIESRPMGDAVAQEPLFKARVAPLAVRRIDRVVVAVAR